MNLNLAYPDLDASLRRVQEQWDAAIVEHSLTPGHLVFDRYCYCCHTDGGDML